MTKCDINLLLVLNNALMDFWLSLSQPRYAKSEVISRVAFPPRTFALPSVSVAKRGFMGPWHDFTNDTHFIVDVGTSLNYHLHANMTAHGSIKKRMQSEDSIITLTFWPSLAVPEVQITRTNRFHCLVCLVFSPTARHQQQTNKTNKQIYFMFFASSIILESSLS